MNYDGIFAFYRVILFWGETRQEVEENIKLLHRANVLKECVEPKRCIDAIWESDELVSKYFNAESLYFGSVMLRTHITEHSTQVLEPDENKPLFFALVFNDHTAFTFQGKYVLSQPSVKPLRLSGRINRPIVAAYRLVTISRPCGGGC